jgi:hypothetical protein
MVKLATLDTDYHVMQPWDQDAMHNIKYHYPGDNDTMGTRYTAK